MDKEELPAVIKDLDDMALRMLRLMKEYIDVKLSLEGLIKAGCLDLAKSRYIMGNRSVSGLQLPTEGGNEFTASTKVLSSKVDASDEVTFKLNRLSIKENENGVKSRRSKNDEDCEEMDDNKDSSLEKVQDPLKWFGVLVPQNMRQAQTSFSKALEYVIQGTNIQLEMDQLKVLYKLKLQKKQELLLLC